MVDSEAAAARPSKSYGRCARKASSSLFMLVMLLMVVYVSRCMIQLGHVYTYPSAHLAESPAANTIEQKMAAYHVKREERRVRVDMSMSGSPGAIAIEDALRPWDKDLWKGGFSNALELLKTVRINVEKSLPYDVPARVDTSLRYKPSVQGESNNPWDKLLHVSEGIALLISYHQNEEPVLAAVKETFETARVNGSKVPSVGDLSLWRGTSAPVAEYITAAIGGASCKSFAPPSSDDYDSHALGYGAWTFVIDLDSAYADGLVHATNPSGYGSSSWVLPWRAGCDAGDALKWSFDHQVPVNHDEQSAHDWYDSTVEKRINEVVVDINSKHITALRPSPQVSVDTMVEVLTQVNLVAYWTGNPMLPLALVKESGLVDYAHTPEEVRAWMAENGAAWNSPDGHTRGGGASPECGLLVSSDNSVDFSILDANSLGTPTVQGKAPKPFGSARAFLDAFVGPGSGADDQVPAKTTTHPSQAGGGSDAQTQTVQLVLGALTIATISALAS